jgi:RND superfamily putative drug exporter
VTSRHRRAQQPQGAAATRWRRAAQRVVRRPLLWGGIGVVLLVVLATPLRHLDLALADDTVLPAAAESRLVDNAL